MDEYRLKQPEAPQAKTDAPQMEKSEGSTPAPVLEKEPEKVEFLNTINYYGVKDYGRLTLEPELDSFGIVPKMTYIDQAVKQRIKELGIKDDESGYKHVLEKIEAHLGLNKKMKTHIRVLATFNMLRTIEKAMNDSAEINNKISQFNKIKF